MSKQSARLGKGLSALISSRAAAREAAAVAPAPLAAESPVRELSVEAIRPNPRQPRQHFDQASLQELADSIRSKGVLQPVVVRALSSDQFEMVAGERRWRASQLADLKTIPAIVRELSDADAFEIALIENLQREDLAPLERASAYQHYLDTFGGSIEGLAQRLAESRANVSNYLRLLKLQPEICYMLGNGSLGMGQARALAGVNDPRRQLALARIAARRNLSVRQVEDLTREAEKSPLETQKAESRSADGSQQHLVDVERAFSKSLGLRVRLRPGKRKNSGRIVVQYNNLDEFDLLAQKLGVKLDAE